MNIIKNLKAHIEERLTETKFPCKNYGTEAAAEKATAEMARIVANHHGCEDDARYVVFYVESWGRWVGAIDLTELLGRADCQGGYIMLCGSKDFYTF